MAEKSGGSRLPPYSKKCSLVGREPDRAEVKSGGTISFDLIWWFCYTLSMIIAQEKRYV